MSASQIKIDPRLEELLVDQALFGLDENDESELRELLGDDPDGLENSFMATAALAQVGLLSGQQSVEKMPGRLRSDILSKTAANSSTVASAEALDDNLDDNNVVRLSSTTASSGTATARQSRSVTAKLGWALAAAFALALVFVQVEQTSPEGVATRSELIATASDTVVIPWARPASAGYEQVRGDVVWSDTRQSGFMRLAGLPANDPAVAQYQLWIVDADRSPQPVDGGVFDMPAGTGEVVIPIDAKLAVNAPTVFAITLEQPGGVVVSAGPLLVIAASGS